MIEVVEMEDYDKEMTEKMSKEDKKAYGDYSNQSRAKSDLHTLMEYAMIKKDPERMKMARHCAKQKAKDLDMIIEE